MSCFCCAKSKHQKQDSGKTEERASIYSSQQSVMAEIKDLFDLFDQDKNGEVTKDEILNTFNSLRLPITAQHAEKLVIEFDANGDNQLQFDEFVNLIKKYLNESDYPTQGMFKYFDRDGDGYITLEEFVKSMRCVGIAISDAEASEVVPKYFLPGTEFMDYDNFNKLMQNLLH